MTVAPPRRLRWAVMPVLVGVALILATLAGARDGTVPAAAQAVPPRVVVWVAGVNTTSDETPFAVMEAALVAAGAAGGWADPARTTYQTFSYAYPNPSYGCEDTWNGSIGDQAARLEAQIAAIAADRPGAEIAIIGHSQGGLIALAYLARLRQGPDQDWRPPLPGNSARVTHLVAIGSPLGGIPSTFAALTDLAAQLGVASDCGEVVADPRNTADMRAIYRSAGGEHPRGASASVAQVTLGAAFAPRPEPYSNQRLALDASFASIGVLSVGNLADWVYQPCGRLGGVLPGNLDTQWLRDEPAARVFGRVFTPIGAAACTTLLDVSLNHVAGLVEPAVLAAVATFLDGGTPDTLAPAPNQAV